MVYIQDFDGWPVEVYSHGRTDTQVRATGTLLKKDDLPVFVWVPRKGTLPPAGIIVSSEVEKEQAKWRYLLADVKWEVITKSHQKVEQGSGGNGG